MEQKREEMMEQRKRRYEELRSRASEVGLQLPETPPWEQAELAPPDMPTPPDMPAPPEMAQPPQVAIPAQAPEAPGRSRLGRGGMTPEQRDAMREERYQAMRKRAAEQGVELPETPPWKLMSEEERAARREMMRSLTPEQREAMREQHWKELRERAAEKGMEMPETPPWKAAAERRKERQAKWEAYRKVIEEMSDEQREAAAAVFGRPEAPPRQMAPRAPMQAPYGAPGGAPYQMRNPNRMMPGYGVQGGPGPWYGGEEAVPQGPPPPRPGYHQPW
jgi:hypothetical protein